MSRALFASRLIENPGSVLDVGCRDGELSNYLPGPYSGADLFPGPKVKYAGDITKMDIAERFDTVFALDILEHVESPSALFDRLVPLARKQVVVSLPNCYDLKDRWLFVRGHRISEKYRFAVDEPLDRHRWMMTYREILDWLEGKAEQHGLGLRVHDLSFGASGGGNFIPRAGRMIARILPPSLSSETVFGVFTKSRPS